jgi:type IX secretion system PorP/SprF family membrane protein
MKKLKLLLLTMFLTSIICAHAQQLPNASYFMYDYTRTNPGSYGSKDMVCASLIGKQSMVGFEGAPTSLFANISAPFNLFGAKHGVGLSVYSDEIGYYSDIDVKLGYAFRLSVADGHLGIGFNANIRQKSLDGTKLDPGELGDPSDQNFPNTKQENLNAFGAGFGLFYRSEDIYLGASALNIYTTEIEYEESTATESIVPHYFVTAGYKIQLSNPAYEITPSVQFYSDGVSTTFDINGTLLYNKRLWGGVSYRAGSAVVGMVGLMILDGLKVGYAYDYNTSAISSQSSGGHEVLLNYCFKIGVEKSPQRYRSIRYL